MRNFSTRPAQFIADPGRRPPMPLAVTLFLLFTTGCTSISSTLLQRDESNTHWHKYPRLHGIPITLKVPTHLKLYVFDKHYLEVVSVGSQPVVQPVELDVPVRDFAQEFLYTDKIFTVDFKRPAGGSYNLRLAMSDEQYFKQIQHDITDTTIQDVTTLLGDIFPAGGMFTKPITASAPDVKEVKSLVAVGVFEIDAPDLEAQLLAFLNCHLNKAHDAWVAPPGVETINRVGVPVDENREIPYPDAPLCPDGNCSPVGPAMGAPFPSYPVTIEANGRDGRIRTSRRAAPTRSRTAPTRR